MKLLLLLATLLFANERFYMWGEFLKKDTVHFPSHLAWTCDTVFVSGKGLIEVCDTVFVKGYDSVFTKQYQDSMLLSTMDTFTFKGYSTTCKRYLDVFYFIITKDNDTIAKADKIIDTSVFTYYDAGYSMKKPGVYWVRGFYLECGGWDTLKLIVRAPTQSRAETVFIGRDKNVLPTGTYDIMGRKVTGALRAGIYFRAGKRILIYR